MRRYSNEYGETQVGIIIAALVIGCLSWALFSLQGCIKEHKASRDQLYREQGSAKNKPKFQKKSRNYKVRY